MRIRTLTPLLLVFLSLTAAAGRAAAPVEWKPAPAPLMTRWARGVRPDHVRTDYPRPQAVRKEWLSLNGLWDFDFDDKDWGRNNHWSYHPPLPQTILVPFTYEAALSGIGKGTEVHERVWYRRTFHVPQSWRDRTIRLNFNACDWEATVWVNGELMGTHRGGYDPFSFDITGALYRWAPNEVVVAVYDPADTKTLGVQPKGKQLGSQGIFYTRTTGIWQTVWLEPVHENAFRPRMVDASVNHRSRWGEIRVLGDCVLPTGGTVDMEVSLRGQTVAAGTMDARHCTRGAKTISATCTVKECRLWSPEEPTLYDITFRVRSGGQVVDEVRSYCAFRSVQIENGRLTLNGKPYFYRGVLDQGYWPDGILTPPSDEAIRADVEMVKTLGFNMARKHVKVEDPRWYYWCDRLGLAVWQDMPSSHNLASYSAQNDFWAEWKAILAATRDHPCIVQWIPFNENWGNPGVFQDTVVARTRALDPSRPITDASGWTQREQTDVIDAHDYTNNLLAQGVKEPVKPKVVGEYGGIALPVAGHTWTQGWGYQTARDPEGLLGRVRYQTSQLFEAANLSGFVYTQLTDVEQELNGLLTYDRQPKANPVLLRAVFEGRDRSLEPIADGFLRDWLVFGPLPTGTALRAANNSPENRAVMARILQQSYLPSEATLRPREGDTATVGGQSATWRQVKLDGDALDFHRVFGGETQNQVAYAAAEITVPKELKNVTLFLGSDDGARVWLNGQEVFTVDAIRGVQTDQDAIPGLTLMAGRNVLLVKVGQGVGGWGLAARLEGPGGKLINIAH